ncbi:hypothetical protein IWW47_001835 [Coemansia sp. RSA 2052]|nr:hypothetical protein IWW47_001835 [Coemansia sp. RSA 2052]
MHKVVGGATRLAAAVVAAPRLSASMVVTAPIFGGATEESAAYNYRVLMVRRAEGGSFESALVFPGGVEEASDSRDAARWHTDAHRVCAVRETFEETGLLLTTEIEQSSTQHPTRSSQPFSALCMQHGARPLDTRLIGRWITPRAKAIRFDTRFYMLNIKETDKFLLSQLDSGRVQESELVAMDWVRPDEVLLANAQSRTALFPPQFYILTELARHRRWQDLARHARSSVQAETPIEPVLCRRSDGRVIALLPGDRTYPAMDCGQLTGSELAIRDADLFVEDDGDRVHRIVMRPAASKAGGFHAAGLHQSPVAGSSRPANL